MLSAIAPNKIAIIEITRTYSLMFNESKRLPDKRIPITEINKRDEIPKNLSTIIEEALKNLSESFLYR